MERLRQVVELLLERYGGEVRVPRGEPFEVLVRTILSQNTNDRNRDEAYRRLVERVGSDPVSLARARVEDIREAIRPAGLYNSKAPRIRAVARFVLEELGGDLKGLLAQGEDVVRERLEALPGVGPKTVDILLAFARGDDIMPVDTHVNRVAKRLGFAPAKAGYFEVRRALEAASPKGERVRLHLALILHGRRVCRARNPLCKGCFLRELCPSAHRFLEGK
jgi:endonuclease-3